MILIVSLFFLFAVAECLLAMNVLPGCLAQGQGFLQLTIPEWNIIFLDIYKYFSQKLSTLPKRFQLDDLAKGYFSHLLNTPESWNVIKIKPPPLKYYITRQDSPLFISKEKNW